MIMNTRCCAVTGMMGVGLGPNEDIQYSETWSRWLGVRTCHICQNYWSRPFISGILTNSWNIRGIVWDSVGYQPFLRDSFSALRDQIFHVDVMGLTTSKIVTS